MTRSILLASCIALSAAGLGAVPAVAAEAPVEAGVTACKDGAIAEAKKTHATAKRVIINSSRVAKPSKDVRRVSGKGTVIPAQGKRIPFTYTCSYKYADQMVADLSVVF